MAKLSKSKRVEAVRQWLVARRELNQCNRQLEKHKATRVAWELSQSPFLEQLTRLIAECEGLAEAWRRKIVELEGLMEGPPSLVEIRALPGTSVLKGQGSLL